MARSWHYGWIAGPHDGASRGIAPGRMNVWPWIRPAVLMLFAALLPQAYGKPTSRATARPRPDRRMVPYITAPRKGLIPKILTDGIRRRPQNMRELAPAVRQMTRCRAGSQFPMRSGNCSELEGSLMSTLRSFMAPSTFRTGPPLPASLAPVKPAQSCRIVIVDDDEDYRCALRIHLANESFDVV